MKVVNDFKHYKENNATCNGTESLQHVIYQRTSKTTIRLEKMLSSYNPFHYIMIYCAEIYWAHLD